MTATISVNAQEPAQMQALIGQSLSKINPSKPETMLNSIAELKRVDAMFPDSIQPKYQMALQSLNFSVMNPHAEQTENSRISAPYAASSIWCASFRTQLRMASVTT